MAVGLAAMAFALLCFWSWWTNPIRLLKGSATSVREYYQWGGITGDHSRLVRAQCNEEFFHQFAKQLGLQCLTENQLPDGCPEFSYCPETWWNPPRNYRGAYVGFGHKSRTIILYSNGVLWYDEDEW